MPLLVAGLGRPLHQTGFSHRICIVLDPIVSFEFSRSMHKIVILRHDIRFGNAVPLVPLVNRYKASHVVCLILSGCFEVGSDLCLPRLLDGLDGT